MSINLTKGEKINLSKEVPGLKKVVVGLGWITKELVKKAAKKNVENSGGLTSFFGSLFKNGDRDAFEYEGNTSKCDIDVDATAFLLSSGKLLDTDDIIYFGQKTHKSGAVKHSGDDLTGGSKGDCEQIVIDLTQLPEIYDEIVLIANIYNCSSRKQDFTMLQNAFIRLFVPNENKEICRYELVEEKDRNTAIVFGKLYKHDGEWKFGAIGNFTKDTEINQMVKNYLKNK